MPDLAAIRNYARRQTLIESDDVADVNLRDYANQGIREVAATRFWPFLQAETTIATVAAQRGYNLPADFARLEAVYFADGILLDELTRRQAVADYEGDTSSQPEYFYLWKSQIVLVPTPSVGSLTVYLDYQKTPTELTNDVDTPEWHSAFHLILGDYVASKIWEREEDLEKATFHLNAFYRGVDGLHEYYANRAKDGPLIVGGQVNRISYPWDWMRD